MEQMLSKHEAHTVARQCYNQFVKTYSGLPWATGVMLHTGARIQQIGGDQSPFAPADPSGNGWVGLNPANQGYAVHNTTAGHLVDYFAYDNEQVFQPDVLDVVVQKPVISAVPYINPFTNTVNTNATCVNNPSVYFPRNAAPIQEPVHLEVEPMVLRLFPNPAKDMVTLYLERISDSAGIAYVEVLDVVGFRKIQVEPEDTTSGSIAVYDLQNGNYTVLVHLTDGQVIRKKFSVLR